ncbi:hypothetical protein ARAM_006875 [Aspergillus rambellii]|uniref:Uncharacterized protein n=1 Tax=Aspergillus rambellii TaxID=308745 RepID=A0A0F8WCP2_9EURO|nr:hypothetical protein ARAM_006875 [Aspergillus rambellii]
MDYTPGKQLDEAWDSPNPVQKLTVAKELHGYVSQLRNLKGETILGLLITAKRYSHSLRPWKVSKILVGESGHVIAILDWDDAGWHPE